ncbi:MAG: TAXI family TRAP transporter solute-binding subunit [Rhizobiales bacterium]|nr:TAXI family TRAP transporter solute-binding subunit [Hyphomicrobiales bacterium]
MVSPLTPPPMTITFMVPPRRVPCPSCSFLRHASHPTCTALRLWLPKVRMRCSIANRSGRRKQSVAGHDSRENVRMHRLRLRAVLCTTLAAVAFDGGGAHAQTITAATTQPGSLTHSLGSAVAKIATEFAGVRMVVQPQGGSSLLPIAAKISEFGFSNSFDVVFFTSGTGEYQGRGPQKNIRVVARIFPNLSPLYVRLDSPIKNLKDLKGKRIPGGFAAQKSLLLSYTMQLANAGLTYDDVTVVLTPNVVKSADDFVAGKVDSFTFGLGAGKLKEVAAAVGPLRALPMDPDPVAIARAQAILPTSYMMVVKPAPNFPEIRQEMPLVVYDFTMQTYAEVPDDVVYKVAKAMHDHTKELTATFAGLRRFNPKEMAIKYDGLEYHPGAIKFYKEIGQWPPKER